MAQIGPQLESRIQMLYLLLTSLKFQLDSCRNDFKSCKAVVMSLPGFKYSHLMVEIVVIMHTFSTQDIHQGKLKKHMVFVQMLLIGHPELKCDPVPCLMTSCCAPEQTKSFQIKFKRYINNVTIYYLRERCQSHYQSSVPVSEYNI